MTPWQLAQSLRSIADSGQPIGHLVYAFEVSQAKALELEVEVEDLPLHATVEQAEQALEDLAQALEDTEE